MQSQLIIILLVALALILVTVQNPNPVALQFLSWEAQQVPLIIVILISLLVGMVISTVLSLIKQSKLKERIRRLQSQLDQLQSSPEAADKEDEQL